MKFAYDINLRPAVTTEKDQNTLWNELDESVKSRKRNYMQFKSSNTKLCTEILINSSEVGCGGSFSKWTEERKDSA